MINGWFEHPDFSDVVAQSWEYFKVVGQKGFVLKEKLKLLRAKLKVWNKEVFSRMDLNISNLVLEMNELDSMIAR